MRKSSSTEDVFESLESAVFYPASQEEFVPSSVPSSPSSSPVVSYSAAPRLSADSGVGPDVSPDITSGPKESPVIVPGPAAEIGPAFTKIPDFSLSSENVSDLPPAPMIISTTIIDDGKVDVPGERRILARIPRLEETSVQIETVSIEVENPRSESAPRNDSNLGEETSASSSNGGHFCRVCLESEDIGVLLKPCSCRGTSAYCHTSCLQQWLRIKTKESPDSAEDILRCGVCKERFNVKITYEQRDRRIISQICKQKKDVLKFLFWFYFFSMVAISPILIFRSCVDFLAHRSIQVLIVFVLNCVGFIVSLVFTIYGVNAWLLPAFDRWIRSNRQLVVSPASEDESQTKNAKQCGRKRKRRANASQKIMLKDNPNIVAHNDLRVV